MKGERLAAVRPEDGRMENVESDDPALRVRSPS